MTNQATNKTKKIKIIVAIILSAVTIIGGIFVSTSLIKISHIMKFNSPDKIVVYYNSSSNNIVFEQDDDEYHAICKMIDDAHKQTVLTSIFNGQIFKDVDVVEHNLKKIDFSGFKVSFVYNSPQIVKLENKIYSNNLWYQTLMFDISSADKFDYNYTAIISPENNNVETISYCAHYMSYSNFSNLHGYLMDIFK